MHPTFEIKRLGLLGQVLFILLSAAPFWFAIYWLIPWLAAKGYHISLIFSISLILPLFLLFVAALIYGLRESSGGLKGLFARWQLRALKWKDLGWLAFLLAVSVVSYLTLANISSSINSSLFGISPPAQFNLIHTSTTFFGITVAGNWWALVAHFGILIINVFGEELWFRGILFPKQKLMFGKRAWWIHGLCYYLWHMFYPWDVLTLLPTSLAYGWVMHKTDNTWTTIIAHFIFNGIGLAVTFSKIIQ